MRDESRKFWDGSENRSHFSSLFSLQILSLSLFLPPTFLLACLPPFFSFERITMVCKGKGGMNFLSFYFLSLSHDKLTSGWRWGYMVRVQKRGDFDRGGKREGADEFYVSNSLSEPEPKLVFFVTVPSFLLFLFFYIRHILISREVQVPQKQPKLVGRMPQLSTKG